MPLHTVSSTCESCGEKFVSVRSTPPRASNSVKHHPARFCTSCSRQRVGWKKNETEKRTRKPENDTRL